MNFKENESDTKLRGGYYTPDLIARFLTKWVLVKRPRSILEPSCGDGQFIRAFQGQHRHKISITAIETMGDEAKKARTSTSSRKSLNVEVLHKDFIEWSLGRLDKGLAFDAIVGNPPYIRYQYLEKQSQKLAEHVFAHFKLAFTKHTNAWVPFVISSLALLRPGGRLAMVIPSELLHVLHAAPLRKFLLTECKSILMIDPTQLLFEDALQGTILLMVEKKVDSSKSTRGVAIFSAPDNSFLEEDPEQIFNNAKYISGEVLNGKWMKVLLDPKELCVFEKASHYSQVKKFSDIASVDVGIVTGANKFFLVNDETIRKYELERFSHPMFGRSEHCPGVTYDEQIHISNKGRGLAANFVMLDTTPFNRLPKKAKEYIRLGETQQLHTRYKCRIRSPWYVVPSVYKTEIGMLKRSHNFPRLILNSAGAYTTDTAYRIKTQAASPAKLVYCFVNSLTALTAELEGRHYGGGVLELVPSEIEKLLVPVPDDFDFDLDHLNQAVKAGVEADALLAQQDNQILSAVGLKKKERSLIHEAWRRIRFRRHRLLGE